MAVVSYKCPNCDGELVFHPRTQKYKCEYCASAFSQEEINRLQPKAEGENQESNHALQEENQANPHDPMGENQENAHAPREETGSIYHCPSCGAEIVTEETTAASFCYYCHNPVILSGRVSGEFLPDKIIPFAIDRKQAVEKFLDYVHHKKFVPRAFFHKSQIEKISGVYFPYWMADMDLEGALQAEGRNVRVWRSGDTEYTETKVYRVEREGEIHLEDITRNALKKANGTLAQGVLPYDVSHIQEFQMSYLSGFLAEKRDMERAELENGVKGEAEAYGKQLLRETVKGYHSVSVKNCRLSCSREHWDYVMLPVWTVTYQGRDGKMYYYSMNGQNGKVCGELPVDYKKVWTVSGLVSLIVFVLGLVGGFLI